MLRSKERREGTVPTMSIFAYLNISGPALRQKKFMDLPGA